MKKSTRYVEPDPAPRRPHRQFTSDDLRYQRYLLQYGGLWEDHYECPPRPWSPGTEQYCDDVLHALELEDWDVGVQSR